MSFLTKSISDDIKLFSVHDRLPLLDTRPRRLADPQRFCQITLA